MNNESQSNSTSAEAISKFSYFSNHGDDNGRRCYTICFGDWERNEETIVGAADSEEEAIESCNRLNAILAATSKSTHPTEEEAELYIWDAPNGSLEAVDNMEAAEKYVRDNFIDGGEIHIDIESVMILKVVADVVVIETDGTTVVNGEELPNAEVKVISRTVSNSNPGEQETAIERFADKMKDCKVTFGLTEDNMSVINSQLSFDGAEYSTMIWESIGKKIGWCPLTAALWYFRKTSQPKTSEQEIEKAAEVYAPGTCAASRIAQQRHDFTQGAKWALSTSKQVK